MIDRNLHLYIVKIDISLAPSSIQTEEIVNKKVMNEQATIDPRKLKELKLDLTSFELENFSK